MSRAAILLLLVCASALIPQTASGGQAAAGIRRLLGATSVTGTIVVPPEWGGIWSAEDSTYDCSGILQSVEVVTDTLCPGEVVVDPSSYPFPFNCEGGADASTVDITCSGSFEVMPDCMGNYTYNLHGTRTGDTYFVVATTEFSYSGTAEGCDLFPGSCTQVNSHGTRTAPPPTQYCETPAAPTTWGRLKIGYR